MLKANGRAQGRTLIGVLPGGAKSKFRFATLAVLLGIAVTYLIPSVVKANVGGYVPICSKVRDTTSFVVVDESPAKLGLCGKGLVHIMRFSAAGAREEVCLDLTKCGAAPVLCSYISSDVVSYKCFVLPDVANQQWSKARK